MKKTVKNFGELENVMDFVFEIDENEKTKKVIDLYYSVDENTKTDELKAVYGEMLPLLVELENENKKVRTFNENASEKTKSKTAVKSFKWLALNDYKPLKLSDTLFENVNKNDKIIFHFSKNVVKTLTKKNTELETENGIKHYTDFVFNDDIDICSVEKIDKKANEIKVKSDLHNIIYYIYVDNFHPVNENGDFIKSRQCVIDCGIPFKVYQKA